MGLFMIGFITGGTTTVFYVAVFPRLARNTRHTRAIREQYENGKITREEYELEESLEKNRISNISTVGLCIQLPNESISTNRPANKDTQLRRIRLRTLP